MLSGCEALGKWMRQGAAAAALVGGAVLASAGAQAATGVPGQVYFTVGGGGGVALVQNCPDIPCNGGANACSCIESSGTMKFSTLAGTLPQPGTYALQISVDRRTATSNGGSGVCYNGTGVLGLTTVKGTLLVPFSGPACRLGAGTHMTGPVPFGMSVPAYIAQGTGSYNNPAGAGTFAGTFNASTNQALITLSGYGILNQPSPP